MRVAPLVLLLLSCSKQPVVIAPASPPSGAESPPSSEPTSTTSTSLSTSSSSTTAPPPPDSPPPATATPLWALDEALADARSGPLTYVGTGEWFGIDKVNACVYRNARVLVVNIYCTPKEMTSVGVVVLSPNHGRVYFYGEAKKPISVVRRADYFSFSGASEPSVVDATLPALDLGFTYAQLRAWDEKRYRRRIASCSAGVEHNKPLNRCAKELKPQTETWVGRNKPFVDAPTDNWYQIVRDLRARAKTDGKNVGRAGG